MEYNGLIVLQLCFHSRRLALYIMADGRMPGIMNMNAYRSQQLAKPLGIQRLEASLDLHPFLAYAQDILSRPLSSSEDSDIDDDSEVLAPGDKILHGILTSKFGELLTCTLHINQHI